MGSGLTFHIVPREQRGAYGVKGLMGPGLTFHIVPREQSEM